MSGNEDQTEVQYRPVRVAASVEWVVGHLLCYGPFWRFGWPDNLRLFHLNRLTSSWSISPTSLLLLPLSLFFLFCGFSFICCLLTGPRPVFMNFSIEHVECHEQGKVKLIRWQVKSFNQSDMYVQIQTFVNSCARLLQFFLGAIWHNTISETFRKPEPRFIRCFDVSFVIY